MPSRLSTPRPSSQRRPSILALAAVAPCASSRPSCAASNPSTAHRQCRTQSGSIPHDAGPAHQHPQRSTSSLLALRRQGRLRIGANIVRNERSKTLRCTAQRAPCSTTPQPRCFRLGNIEGAADAPRYTRASAPVKIPIVPADTATPYLPPRFRALALFRRRPPEPVVRSSLPASENLHTSGREQVQQDAPEKARPTYSMT